MYAALEVICNLSILEDFFNVSGFEKQNPNWPQGQNLSVLCVQGYKKKIVSIYLECCGNSTSRRMSHHNLKVTEVWEIENLQWPYRTNELNFLDLKASETH